MRLVKAEMARHLDELKMAINSVVLGRGDRQQQLVPHGHADGVGAPLGRGQVRASFHTAQAELRAVV